MTFEQELLACRQVVDVQPVHASGELLLPDASTIGDGPESDLAPGAMCAGDELLELGAFGVAEGAVTEPPEVRDPRGAEQGDLVRRAAVRDVAEPPVDRA